MPFKDPERKKAYQKLLRQDGRQAGYKKKYRSDPEKRAKELAANAVSMREYRKKNAEKARLAVRRSNGCVDATGERKVGPCDICGEHCDPLHFDHCHVSGRFRGWLCGHCNRGIGMLKDSPKLLEAAIAYLTRLA